MGFYTDFLNTASSVTRLSGGVVRNAGPIVEAIIGRTGIHQEIGDYHVTTLYPSRGPVGTAIDQNPIVRRSLARAASILSGVPTHGLQGAQYGSESSAFHIITKKGEDNNSTAIHATNVATLHKLMFFPTDQLAGNDHVASIGNLIRKSPIAKGFLDNVTALNDGFKNITTSSPFSNLTDKAMMYLSSYSGMMGMYGSLKGFDAWYVNNDRLDGYTAESVRGRLSAGLSAIKAAFNISPHDNTMIDQAMTTHTNALSKYTRIHTNASEYSDSTARLGDINNFGFAHNQLENYVLNLSEGNRTFSHIVNTSYDPATFSRSASGNSTRITPATPTTAPTSTPTPPPASAPLPDPPASITVPSNIAPPVSHTAADVMGDVLSTMDTVRVPPIEEPVRSTPVSIDALLDVMGSDHYGTFLETYSAVEHNASANIAHNYVNRDIISVISDSAFRQLEQRYPIGSLETTPDVPGNLSANVRTINALQEVRARIESPNGTDRDAKFYEKLGANALPKNSFDIRNYRPENMSAFVKQRLKMGGALVGINADGSQKWLIDDIGRTTENIDYDPNRTSTDPRDTNAWRGVRDVNLHGMPAPDIDFNHNNMRLVNTTMSVNDALNNGYVIPIKGNDAVFVPSFTALDFTYGMELEALGVVTDAYTVRDAMRTHFGYDMDKMGFKGKLQAVDDPSVPGGKEYVTPIMSGVRAIKGAYILGETLKILGARHGGYSEGQPGESRNDPSSIHVNVGTVPDLNKASTLKFAADYLRLTEEVFKKMTNPDLQFRYSPLGTSNRVSGNMSNWAMRDAIQPNSLRLDNPNDVHEYRQFWSQSISDVRMAGNTGMSEYQFLREHGTFYSDLSGMRVTGAGGDTHLTPRDNQDRMAKYKTMAIHKLLLQGVMEIRTGMYLPGGDEAVAQLVMASKLASDIYQGASNGDTGNVAVTDKLVPPTDGWGTSERDQHAFNETLRTVFGIDSVQDQNFVREYYNKCKAGRY